MVEFNTAAETKPRLAQFGIKIQKPRYIIVQYFFVYYIRKSVAARKVCNFLWEYRAKAQGTTNTSARTSPMLCKNT